MIDWPRVGELRDDVGAEDFDEVVELFLEEVAEVVACLSTNPNPAQFEANLHFLKGSSLNLGFAALGTICADGEKLSRNGQPGDVDIAAVIATYESSIIEFKARLRHGLAA